MNIEQEIKKMSLIVNSVFVPFSQGVNKDNKDDRGNVILSLNWKITLCRTDLLTWKNSIHSTPLPILTTDYSAGIGHAPSYKKIPSHLHTKLYADNVFRYEAEKGKEIPNHMIKSIGIGYSKPIAMRAKNLKPKTTDVLYNLVVDSDVLEHNSFEDWAEYIGYNTDSIKAEKIYNKCLEIALKLRNGVGDKKLTRLRELFQDY